MLYNIKNSQNMRCIIFDVLDFLEVLENNLTDLFKINLAKWTRNQLFSTSNVFLLYDTFLRKSHFNCYSFWRTKQLLLSYYVQSEGKNN